MPLTFAYLTWLVRSLQLCFWGLSVRCIGQVVAFQDMQILGTDNACLPVDTSALQWPASARQDMQWGQKSSGIYLCLVCQFRRGIGFCLSYWLRRCYLASWAYPRLVEGDRSRCMLVKQKVEHLDLNLNTSSLYIFMIFMYVWCMSPT